MQSPVLTSQRDAEEGKQQMSSMAMMHDKAKQAKVIIRGVWKAFMGLKRYAKHWADCETYPGIGEIAGLQARASLQRRTRPHRLGWSLVTCDWL